MVLILNGLTVGSIRYQIKYYTFLYSSGNTFFRKQMQSIYRVRYQQQNEHFPSKSHHPL